MNIKDNCSEATFSITGEGKAKCIEGVEVFKYLGLLLYLLGENWPAILWNAKKAQQVWGRLGKIL